MPAPTWTGPRERLAQVGAAALSDEELIAILLGTGSRGEPVTVVAARLLGDAGGLRGLEHVGVGTLAARVGLGPTKAARLLAAVEVGRRVVALPLLRGARLVSSRDIDAALRPTLGRATQEHFLAIPLDAKNRPLAQLTLSTGGLSACPVHPSDVFRAVLREAASSVVFVHNHPSGEPDPSHDDIQLTHRLCLAGELLGVRVLDHIILGRNAYFSFLDAGMLPTTVHSPGADRPGR